jgi:hypothetical protein
VAVAIAEQIGEALAKGIAVMVDEAVGIGLTK